MKKLSNITGDDLSIEPCSQAEKGDWLVKILGLSGSVLPAIREEVMDMKRERELEHGDRPKRDISYEVSSKLIKRSAIKAGAVGSITAAPASLPVIGTIGTAIVGATADLAYLIRTQIELCYAISAAYDARIDEEELKAVTIALLGFSGSAEMVKGIAASTLKNIVDAATARYLKKGIADVAAEVGPKITRRLLGRAYKLIPFIGIPLSASINIASTMIVGNQARKYFSRGGYE
ncbi:MAG TPA: hypothetical protein HPP41_00105 [Deltaproteobacteria bacterium]|nr:hypothetical protein [Deltaproteobacteria bacterium]